MRKPFALFLASTLVAAGMAASTVPALATGPDAAPLVTAVGLTDAVNLAGPGYLPVVVLTTEGLDATELDVAAVTINGDDRDTDGVAPAQVERGRVPAPTDPLVHHADLNGDGRDDLVVHFDKADLIAAGELTSDTGELVVAAELPDGRTVEGAVAISPEVVLELKFAEDLRVRGTDRTLRSQRGRSLQDVRRVLDAHGGGELEPMIDAATATRLGRVAADARALADEALPDLPSWYTVTLPADADPEAAVGDLLALDEIEHAYPAPEPAPPPQAVDTDTPDFTDMQVYFGPAQDNGIDADFSRADPRLRGEGIKIVDLEYNWNPYHEDLLLDEEPEPDTSNLALAATPSCSYTSPWESCAAINSGTHPPNSNPPSGQYARWGTWPETGDHWIQLTWDEPQTVSATDLYWFQDSTDGSNSGVKRPTTWSLEYWDGDQFVEVPDPSGYGDTLDDYNRTLFGEVTTTRLRANVTTRSDAQGVGALEWRVYEQDPGPIEPTPDEDWTTDLGGGQFVRIDTFGDDHGTAVFGELVAIDNDYGVTGGVPDADMYGISPVRQFASGATSWQPGPALAFLAALEDDDGEPFLQPGDAVLLEQQTNSPSAVPGSFAPLEWIPSVFDAIVTLTAMGVNVVSTGGNGNTDSDHPGYTRDGVNGWFDPDFQHSGSILVGAGGSGLSSQGPRERLNFSNYGTRFDLQGWGQNIVTTGYCTLYCVQGNHNIRYSQTFSGTSGAGPIVTAAVVAVQSYVKSTGHEPWSAQQVADVLKATGQPQGPNSAHQHIGPLPDLRAALISIEVDPPQTHAELTATDVTGLGWYVKPIIELTADDGWGSGVASVQYRIDGGPWITYDGPVLVDGTQPPRERTFEYRSIDHNSNIEQIQELRFVAVGKHD